MPTNPFPSASKLLIMSVLLAGLGVAGAAEQQASFAVAITLHTISKPLAASQLCPEGKPLDRVGVSISVSCPGAGGGDPADSDAQARFLRAAGRPNMGPTVVVTF